MRTPELSATRWIGLAVLLAVALGAVALLVPLRTGFPLLTGGPAARAASCGPAVVAWSDGLDDPDRSPPSISQPGRDTGACRDKATGRIALVVVGAALLGSVLVLIDMRRNRRSPTGDPDVSQARMPSARAR